MQMECLDRISDAKSHIRSRKKEKENTRRQMHFSQGLKSSVVVLFPPLSVSEALPFVPSDGRSSSDNSE